MALNIRVSKMSIDTPIDVDFAVNGLGGEKSMFYMMLGKLEDMAMN